METQKFAHAALAIAEAPFTDGGWVKALSLTRDALCVRAIRISAVDVSTGRWRHAVSGAPEAASFFAAKQNFGAPLNNPRVAFALTAPLHKIWTDEDIAPIAERRKWDIYRDLWEPYGCEFGWTLVLFRSGDTMIFATAADNRSAVRRTEIPEALSRLVSLLSTAATREHTLRLREAAIVGHSTTALNTGAIALDGFGRPIHVNAIARDYLQRGGVLTLRGSRLHALESELDAHLQTLILDATRADGPVRAEVRLPGDGGRFVIMPLDTSEDDCLGLGPAATVIINPMRARAGDYEDKATQLGFSAAERSILPAVLAGASIDEISVQRGTTRETVRSQLKSIYAKAGVNSRAELMISFLGGGSSGQ